MRARAGSQPVRARADAGVDSGAEEEEGATEPNAGLGDGDGGAFWEGLGGRAGLAPSFSGVPPPGPGGEFESELAKREAELALREERILVREFQRDLAFNLRKARAPAPAYPSAAVPWASSASWLSTCARRALSARPNVLD
jgi:hypothetical protein